MDYLYNYEEFKGKKNNSRKLATISHIQYGGSYGRNFKNDEIEEVLTSCHNIESIFIRANKKSTTKLTVIEGLKNLKKLTEVELIIDDLEAVSDEIGTNNLLQKLIIQTKTETFHLPSSVADITQLKEVILEAPTVILPSLSAWKNVEKITIKANQIENIKELQHLSVVKEICIHAPVSEEDILSLQYLEKLTTLEIVSDQLSSIHFQGFYNLKELVIKAKKLISIQNITTLSLLTTFKLEAPKLADIFSLEGNNKLVCFHAKTKLSTLPTALFSLPNLTECELTGFLMESFSISNTSLTHLTLQNCKNLADLPDFSRLPLTYLQLNTLPQLSSLENANLPLIKSLDEFILKKLIITDLPEFIHSKINLFEMKGMENISEKKDFMMLMKVKAKKFKLAGIKITKSNEEAIQKFIYALSKSPINIDDQSFFFNIFFPSINRRNIEPKKVEYTKQQLLKLSAVNHALLKKEATRLISKQIGNDLGKNNINPKMKIAILGTTGTKKTDFKQRLEAINITYHPKIKEDTTHVVIGKGIKDFDIDENISWVAENLLTTYINAQDKPFLLETEDAEENTNNIENIRSLLMTSDEDNALVGFELLKTGGVPKELYIELLFLLKTSESKKVKAQAKKILIANAPAIYQKVIADRSRFASSKSEKDLNSQFKGMHNKYTGIDWFLFAYYFYQKFGKGLRFIIDIAPKNNEIRKKLFKEIVQDNVLDFHKVYAGAGYTPSYTNSYAYWSYKPSDMPLEVFDNQQVQELNLKSLLLGKIPAEIQQLQDLRILNCSYNMLKELPPEITQLQKLEELNISENEFEEFPMILKKLPNLKTVNISFNRKGESYYKLEIPQEIKDALPNCKFVAR